MTWSKGNFVTSKIMSKTANTGTHIDAPAHLIEGLKTLDQLQIGHYFGDAVLVDFRNIGRNICGFADTMILLPCLHVYCQTAVEYMNN